MADHTITADQQGAYEFPVTAGTTVTVHVVMEDRGNSNLQVIAHDGDDPVYARKGTSVTPGDGHASLVMQGSWMSVWCAGDTDVDLSVTSRSDAIVSVARA
jgi:hypothetical protein